MGIDGILQLSILLFIIIYSSVRLAIYPLLNKKEESNENNQDFGLVKLRDMGIFSNDELEEVIELYRNRSVKEEEYKQYQKYEKVLNELKDIDYFTEDEHFTKLDMLKKFFMVD